VSRPPVRYAAPVPDGLPSRYLEPADPDGCALRCLFFGRLEIGRDEDGRAERPGLLLVADPTVSRAHCVITQGPDGRCFVRDLSRNGTRLGGRRLVPNIETEWQLGQRLEVGSLAVVLGGEPPAETSAEPDLASTIPRTDRCIATVLVGDIRDYTVLVREALSEDLQRSVSRVFDRLGAAVVERGGTVKELQGDAILAFWEGDASGRQAVRPCRAALALDRLAASLAADRSVWNVEGSPLVMEWALATGLVLIDSAGKQAAGLSMMGEPVVRAFRMEKFASRETGRILACEATREMAGDGLAFRDLGTMTAKGFDRPDRVFALVGEPGGGNRPGAAT